MNPIKQILILLLAAAIGFAAAVSCSPDMEPNYDSEYATADLLIGGIVYQSSGISENGEQNNTEENEPITLEGIHVRIDGTEGYALTNQHGLFLITTSKTIDINNLDETITIHVNDLDGTAGGGRFKPQTITHNIGKLVVWDKDYQKWTVRDTEFKIYLEPVEE